MFEDETGNTQHLQALVFGMQLHITEQTNAYLQGKVFRW